MQYQNIKLNVNLSFHTNDPAPRIFKYSLIIWALPAMDPPLLLKFELLNSIRL